MNTDSTYAKGQKVEVRNANNRWSWQGYATGRHDVRGVEVTVYYGEAGSWQIRTQYIAPADVRAKAD